jgi:hypothetical protein
MANRPRREFGPSLDQVDEAIKQTQHAYRVQGLEIPAIPDETPARVVPGDSMIRDKANALTEHAFRNGPVECLHARKLSP